MRSSITDTSDFRLACAAAADDLDSAFKQDAVIVKVIEHVDPATGAAYLDTIRRQTPELLALLPALTRADQVGVARVHEYPGVGTLSPNLCRYLKVLSDICLLFPDLSQDKSVSIIEVGGGYGGQAYVLAHYFRSLTYTIIDLPEAGALQAAYLRRLAPDLRLTTATPDDIAAGRRSDLAISNYALSECRKDQAADYTTAVLNQAPRGYLTCNFNDARCPSRHELESWISAATSAYAETPLTWMGNYLLTWGATKPAGWPPLPAPDPAEEPFDPRTMRDRQT
jgi:hypothetical protein